MEPLAYVLPKNAPSVIFESEHHEHMNLYIKYMVSLRCKMLVKEELHKLGMDDVTVELGVVEIQDDITMDQREALRNSLAKSGLELLDDKRNILVEKIKNVIVELIHHAEDLPNVNDSEYISKKLGYDYTYLSNTFSEVKGMTIQKFIILNKIEKAKEMLLYDEDNLTEIAYKLNYSSVAHLSNQFKKITGFTPSFFKNMKLKRVRNLEDL